MSLTSENTNLEQGVLSLYRENRVNTEFGSYTWPAPKRYPYQWLWDSCFHSMVLRHYDLEVAQSELNLLLRGQVQTGNDKGMIPHMIYWEGSGKDLWGEESRSIITQPPLVALAAVELFEKSPNKEFLKKVYESVLEYHAWFDRRRSFDNGLVAIIHPWESGWDSASRWDQPFQVEGWTEKDRREKRSEYVRIIREHNCDMHSLRQAGFFCVAPVCFNAIRVADIKALSVMADRLGDLKGRQELEQKADLLATEMRSLMWDSEDGTFYDFDFVTSKLIGAESAASFITLLAQIPDSEQMQVLSKKLKHSGYWCKYGISSQSLESQDSDPDTYWRGNVWASVNWLIWKGLRNNGLFDESRELALSFKSLVELSGFHEYFNPVTGQGYGPDKQSWTGLVIDMLKEED